MYHDSLYRVTLKCLVTDPAGKVLVVRETGRGSWDLPGGGIDHGEDIKTAIARELYEEVNYSGDFSYSLLTIDNPFKLKTRDVWQMKIVFKVSLDLSAISAGQDVEEIAFIAPDSLKNSDHPPEKSIHEYSQIT